MADESAYFFVRTGRGAEHPYLRAEYVFILHTSGVLEIARPGALGDQEPVRYYSPSEWKEVLLGAGGGHP